MKLSKALSPRLLLGVPVSDADEIEAMPSRLKYCDHEEAFQQVDLMHLSRTAFAKAIRTDVAPADKFHHCN